MIKTRGTGGVDKEISVVFREGGQSIGALPIDCPELFAIDR
ncbi:MAG: hypothetical protein ABI700_15395 [Chloroflexota bacterium]